MARLSTARGRVRALPTRAKAALGVALALIVALVAWAVVAVVGGGDGGGDDTAGGVDPSQTSTTMDTGDLDMAVPEGWQPIAVPALGFGIAVPPGWEAVLLSDEGLATLSGAEPAVPDFTDNAHAARAAGGLLYAAGEDAEGRVSDLVVRAAPQTGVTDVAGLEEYARSLATAAGRTDPQVDVVDGAERPTVRLRFAAGAGEEEAVGTETLVIGANDVVWVVTVTSDDAAVQQELAQSITDTLVLSGGG